MTPEEKLRAAKDAQPAEIMLSGEPREIMRQAVAAMATANYPERVFVRGGELTRLKHDEHGRGSLEPMSEGALRVELERSASFLRPTGKDKPPQSIPVPRHVIEGVRALGAWPDIPPVEAIVEGPTLRPDGTVLDTAGYDRATRLIYDPAPFLRVPASRMHRASGSLITRCNSSGRSCSRTSPSAGPPTKQTR